MGEKESVSGVSSEANNNPWVQLALNLFLMIYKWLESIVMAFVPRKLISKDVTGKIVLITGGGSGIGQLLSIRFAKLGAVVVVWDLSDKGMDETCRLVKQEGGVCHKYVCDVSKRQTVYAVAKLVKEQVGIVDILINNAGIVNGKKFLDIPDEKVELTFGVNIMASCWTVKAFLPDMIERDSGHLVYVSSMAGLTGSTHLVDYCSTKFGVVGFEEALRLELRSSGVQGVRSTCVCPYFTNTGLFDGVSTSILPLLKPSYVADCVVDGVLTNQEFVLVPWAMLPIFIMKATIPVSAAYYLYDAVGGRTFMDKFTGRTSKAGMPTNEDTPIGKLQNGLSDNNNLGVRERIATVS